MLTLEDGKTLITLARNSIETYFSRKNLPLSEVKKYDKSQGAFVTLEKYGQLRGCIGYPEPVLPLYKAILQAARAAAFQDPRFPSVSEDELQDITIEVSVLTVPKLLEVESEEYINNIHIGKHGLIIRGSFRSGLLLPQVFTEYKSTPLEALQMTCQKAGMREDAWKDPKNRIFTFESQVFSEEEPYGKVKQNGHKDKS